MQHLDEKLDGKLRALKAEMEATLTWRMIVIVGIFSGIFSGITVAAVGFMLRGLPGVSG